MLLLWVFPSSSRKTGTSSQINGINNNSKPRLMKKYNILAIFIIQCFWGSWFPTSLCHPAPWYLLFTAPTVV